MNYLTRRSLLKTMSLGATAPLVGPMVNRLDAAQKQVRPTRFVFLIEGNGLRAEQLQPIGIERKTQPNMRNKNVKQSAEDKLVDVELAAHELPPALEPLEPVKEHLTIVQGLSGHVCGGGHSNGFGALGCYSARAGAKDVTIDAALAKRVPGIFQHVGLGISRSARQDVIYGCSASGPNQKVPIYTNPALAYDMLFGKILGGNPQAEAGSQGMLLDYLVDDIKRVEKQLPGAERHKMQQYRSAFESIGSRQSRLGEIDPEQIHKADETYASTVETDRLNAHFDMAATALITGMTNVVTLASGAGPAHFEVTFGGLGIGSDKHQIGHRAVDGAVGMEIKIHQFHTKLMAELMQKLAAAPEGEGTMLDNTLIVYLSDSAEAHHSTCYEWPMVLGGGLAGRLKTGNRFINAPGYGEDSHRTVAGFFTALLNATGSAAKHFGQKDHELEGGVDQNNPMIEMLA